MKTARCRFCVFKMKQEANDLILGISKELENLER
jgi:hypothetical protein